jgi:hypothetical protein
LQSKITDKGGKSENSDDIPGGKIRHQTYMEDIEPVFSKRKIPECKYTKIFKCALLINQMFI